MKKLIVLVCLFGFAIGVNAGMLPITNSGFESGFADWTQNPIGEGSTISITSEAYSGSSAALLTTDWQSGVGVKSEIIQVTTTGSITPGTAYDFEIYVKGVMGVGGVAWAEIMWLDTDASDGGGVKGSSGLINLFAGLDSSNYQLKGGTYIAAAGADAAQISIRCEGGAMAAVNTLYVDAVPEPASLGLLVIGSLLLRRQR